MIQGRVDGAPLITNALLGVISGNAGYKVPHISEDASTFNFFSSSFNNSKQLDSHVVCCWKLIRLAS